jgi:hypothetical protein
MDTPRRDLDRRGDGEQRKHDPVDQEEHARIDTPSHQRGHEQWNEDSRGDDGDAAGPWLGMIEWMDAGPDAQWIGQQPSDGEQQERHREKSCAGPTRRAPTERITVQSEKNEERGNCNDGDGHVDRRPPDHGEPAEHVEEAGVRLALEAVEIGIGEHARNSDRLVAHVLQRSRIDVLEIVARRVIERSRIREREIETGQSAFAIDGEVRVVGQRRYTS